MIFVSLFFYHTFWILLFLTFLKFCSKFTESARIRTCVVWLSLPVPEKNQFMCDCFYFHCHAGHCDATDDPVFYEWLLYFSKPHPEWSFLCAHSDMHSVLVCKHATINWYWDTQKSTVIFKIKQGLTNSIPENSCVILHENRKCFDSWLILKIKRTHTHT